MSANLVFLIVLLIFAFCSFAIVAACIKWSLKWTRVAEISLLKSLGLALLFAIAIFILSALAAFILTTVSVRPATLAEIVIDIATALFVPALLIARLYKAPFRNALLATFLYLLMNLTASFSLAYAFRTVAYEAFVIPTNSMAPTVLGNHWWAPCPRCGAPAYGTPVESPSLLPPADVLLVCSHERQSVHLQTVPHEYGGGDRILACKLLSPRRWDIIVFRLPSDPSVKYCKRLVGLPGEELAIRDGAVWINDKKMEPPESIGGIHYSPTINANGREYSGPGSEPVILGLDEYFVLGDFVDGAADSRFWERGAPGYPPYAVPKENIGGVVINIYWPPKRWTSFR